MSVVSKLLKTACIVAGALAFAQAPEFSQQYYQRLGGALEELQAVVDDFDRDAAAVGINRNQALANMTGSSETFIRKRAESMASNIARFENLSASRKLLEAAAPMMAPVVVLQRGDPKLIDGTVLDYQPALPVTIAGLFYGILGGGSGWLLAFLIGLASRPKHGRNQDHLLQKKIAAGNSDGN